MYKILIIEDHYSVRENIEQLLTRSNYEVYSAGNGLEGVRLAHNVRPDLIICDIMMPGMDGHEVLKQLSMDENTSVIPLIFLTAKTEISDLRLGMELGADDYIFKPFNSADLLNAVRVRLEKIEQLKKLFKDKTWTNNERRLHKESVIIAGNPPRILKVADILYITAEKGYSNIFTIEGDKLLIRKLLKKWEAILPDELFIRIHNSTIINIKFMGRVEPWFNHSLRIYIKNNTTPLEVSKRYAPRVKARFRV